MKCNIEHWFRCLLHGRLRRHWHCHICGRPIRNGDDWEQRHIMDGPAHKVCLTVHEFCSACMEYGHSAGCHITGCSHAATPYPAAHNHPTASMDILMSGCLLNIAFGTECWSGCRGLTDAMSVTT